MGSLAASSEAVGDDFLPDLLTIIGGIDGLMGAFLGSVGEVIGVGAAAAAGA